MRSRLGLSAFCVGLSDAVAHIGSIPRLFQSGPNRDFECLQRF